jgi:hypothetical protein
MEAACRYDLLTAALDSRRQASFLKQTVAQKVPLDRLS